eukprot:183089_1
MGACAAIFKTGNAEKQYLLDKNIKTAPSCNTVISIQDILNRNPQSLQMLKKCLIARGWCKISFPSSITRHIKTTMNSVNNWLNETQLDEKLKYSIKLNDGTTPNPQGEYSYHRIDGFKEGIRILSGDMYKIHVENNKYPSQISNDIFTISQIFDNLSLNIMQSTYKTVFALKDVNDFGTKYDISLFNEKMKFSMIDFVNYFNNKQYIEKLRNDEFVENDNEIKPTVLKSEFNVFEHTDPGLFALSFASTNDGLQMFDITTNEWIKIGLNECIWWNGETATKVNKQMKAGKHRVLINDVNYKPRFTGWYEVSCNT